MRERERETRPVISIKGKERGQTPTLFANTSVWLFTRPSFTIGISSDVLYPVSEQKEVAAYLGGGYGEVESEAGHDGFLLEQDEVGRYIREFLATL